MDAVHAVGADRVASGDVEVIDADTCGAAVEYANSHPGVLADLRIDHAAARGVDRHSVARVVEDPAAVHHAARAVSVADAVAPGALHERVLHDEPCRAVGCDAVAAPGHGDAV